MSFLRRLLGSPAAAPPVAAPPVAAGSVDIDPAKALVARLATPGPLPDGDPDPFVTAWQASRDLDAMIGLLLAGGRYGVYEVDEVRTWEPAPGAPPSRWLFRMRLLDRRYVRVDVTREAGIAALRVIVPAMEPRAVWIRAHEEAHDRIEDPLQQLIFALGTSGAAQPAWIARWGSAGDPVAAAWHHSVDSIAMRWLLDRAGRADLIARAQAEMVRGPRLTRGGCMPTAEDIRELEAFKVAMGEAIRRAVPVPPTLPEIYRGAQGSNGRKR